MDTTLTAIAKDFMGRCNFSAKFPGAIELYFKDKSTVVAALVAKSASGKQTQVKRCDYEITLDGFYKVQEVV
jgi:hypothetical protein